MLRFILTIRSPSETVYVKAMTLYMQLPVLSQECENQENYPRADERSLLVSEQLQQNETNSCGLIASIRFS
jgi:hypothetical protein